MYVIFYVEVPVVLENDKSWLCTPKQLCITWCRGRHANIKGLNNTFHFLVTDPLETYIQRSKIR
jgi:hypothetical protein